MKQPEIQNFMREHADDDVAALGLKKPPDAQWPYLLILDQIKARQKAKTKLPIWHAHEEIIFPSSSTLEQASSEATARYKASLLSGDTFADLTCGSGIDTYFAAQNFNSGICIDQDQDTAARAAHNFSALGQANLQAVHANAEAFIQSMSPVDWILLDPQRRNTQKRGLVRLEDCTPDIINLLPALKNKTGKILLKTSPMLDVSATISLLPSASVHILEYDGDCKEILFEIDFTSSYPPDNVPVHAVQLNKDNKTFHRFVFTRKQEKEARAKYAMPANYIYEPGPAFHKSGAFNLIAMQYGVYKLHPHTHLYTSADLNQDFPGKIFKFEGLYPVKAGTLPVNKTNLAIRNFPSDVKTLRKKLKLAEGGDTMVFASTLENNDKALLLTRRIL